MRSNPLLVATAVLSLLQAAPALASEKKKDDKAAAEKTDFELSPIAAPIISGGMVRNYVFITLRVHPAPNADLAALRAKEPFLRDAVVRVAHRTPLTNPASFNAVDEAKARAAFTAEFSAIAGKGQIKSVEVVQQLPRNLVRTPKP